MPAFGSVELAGSNNVTIRVGEQQSVRVYGDDNLIGRVTTDVDATTLVIGDKPGSYAANSPMRVEVSVPSLDELTLSGSGTITVIGVAPPRLAVTISGSGVVRASGTTEQLDVTVSGSGQPVGSGRSECRPSSRERFGPDHRHGDGEPRRIGAGSRFDRVRRQSERGDQVRDWLGCDHPVEIRDRDACREWNATGTETSAASRIRRHQRECGAPRPSGRSTMF